MRFTDGMEIRTDGPLRTVRKSDGWYVVGRGLLIAVDGPKDGAQVIRKLTVRPYDWAHDQGRTGR